MTNKQRTVQPITTPVTTLTLNPAIDVTIDLQKLRVGEVNRAKKGRMNAGGKGINVAATLASGGFKTTATGILGEDNAAFFENFFEKRGIENQFLYTEGATRSNTKMVSATETTDVNLPGLLATPEHLKNLIDQLENAKSDFLVLSGSVPPGCQDSFYADFLELYAHKIAAPEVSAKCFVDCSGQPLKHLLAGNTRPFCIKPNDDELAEWAEKPLNSQEEILEQAKALSQTGIPLVVVSMGGKGALFVTQSSAWFAQIKLDKVESTVGAGDAMVAGIVAACLEEQVKNETITDTQLEAIAKTSTIWAAGKLECHGPTLPPLARRDELTQKLSLKKLY